MYEIFQEYGRLIFRLVLRWFFNRSDHIIRVYVFMYVLMYTWMYVFMYVCMWNRDISYICILITCYYGANEIRKNIQGIVFHTFHGDHRKSFVIIFYLHKRPVVINNLNNCGVRTIDNTTQIQHLLGV